MSSRRRKTARRKRTDKSKIQVSHEASTGALAESAGETKNSAAQKFNSSLTENYDAPLMAHIKSSLLETSAHVVPTFIVRERKKNEKQCERIKSKAKCEATASDKAATSKTSGSRNRRTSRKTSIKGVSEDKPDDLEKTQTSNWRSKNKKPLKNSKADQVPGETADTEKKTNGTRSAPGKKRQSVRGNRAKKAVSPESVKSDVNHDGLNNVEKNVEAKPVRSPNNKKATGKSGVQKNSTSKSPDVNQSISVQYGVIKEVQGNNKKHGKPEQENSDDQRNGEKVDVEKRAASKRAAERKSEIKKPARQTAKGSSKREQGSKPEKVNGKNNAESYSKQNGKAQANGHGNNGRELSLQMRSSDREFRGALESALSFCKKNFITVGIFSVAVNLLILAIPIYLFQVADRVLTNRSLDTLVMLTIIAVGALGVHVLLDMTRRYLLMRIAVRMDATLGGPILSAAVKSSNGSSNRDFQTVIDMQQVRNFVTGPVMLAFFDAPVTPIFFLAVFLIHPQLGFIVTTAAAILMIFALLNQKFTAVPFARASGFNMRANVQADAMSRNTQVINAMGMIPENVRIWGREMSESLKAQVDAQDRNIFMMGLSKFLRLVTQIAMLGWGAYLAIHGELTGGMIIAASIIGGRALAPIEGTIEGWRSFVHARASYGRIKTLLQSSPLNLDRLWLPRPEGKLSVERVLYVPPPNKKVILNGITFSLDPGESLAIVGPSGTGKSTLARMIVGALAPTAGSVRLDQMDIRNWDPRQFGETIGYLPQDVELFPATIKANIARMREDVSDESIFDAAELAGVHSMISEMPQGYETPIAVDGSPLSGGQKQRIGLARAFFGDPKVVVLDEPNSNLDSPGEAALAEALKRAREGKITVVTVTQRPSLLKSVDKIMILNDGKVLALGARDEMISRLTSSQDVLSRGMH